MNVLVACEFSGIVREAFRKRGHNAWSCDLLPSEKEGQHFQCDVRTILDKNWDLMIAHPPCTHLAVSGARWFNKKIEEQKKALDFVRTLIYADIPKICVENPVSIISTKIAKPTQIIQPWQFGVPECKKTCLWLKNLPKLKPTKIIPEGERRQSIWLAFFDHNIPKTELWKFRSRTFQGIADAMAEQWDGT